MGNFEKHDRGDTLNPYEGERNLERDIRDGLYDHLLDANDGMELSKAELFDDESLSYYDDPEVKADLVRRHLNPAPPEPVTPKWRIRLSDGSMDIVSASTSEAAEKLGNEWKTYASVIAVEQVEFDGSGWVRAKS